MSYKKVLSQIGGEVVDRCDDRSGVSPSETIADSGVLDTGIGDFTGILTIDEGTDSTVVTCHVASGTQTIALSGSAAFNAVKDMATTINVYVETGTIQIQNLSGAEISVSARLSQ